MVPPRASRSARAAYALLFLALFVPFSYFDHNDGWNQGVRIAQLHAIVLKHTIKIDAYHQITGDKAYIDGHYYSEKAPAMVVVALPSFALTVWFQKLLGVDPDQLPGWHVSEWVATVGSIGNLPRILENIALKRDDVSWGPNSTFRFPLHGGTGAIWQSVQQLLPAAQLHFDRAIARIDTRRRRIETNAGESIEYDALISTMPLDRLLTTIDGLDHLKAHAPRFVHSSSHIVGVGLSGAVPDALETKCWIYFPEPQVPFYRATVFSNYSPNNAPAGHWSLMAEVSESPQKPVELNAIVEEVVSAFARCGFVDRTNVVSRWHRRLEHGYPTPWLGRDEVLGEVEQALHAAGIYSRGRFGAWKYEVSNQDHSLMQGVEAVERILDGAAERTYNGDTTSDLTSARRL